jgi:hypothetical protein
MNSRYGRTEVGGRRGKQENNDMPHPYADLPSCSNYTLTTLGYIHRHKLYILKYNYYTDMCVKSTCLIILHHTVRQDKRSRQWTEGRQRGEV